ncbi:MAG: DL-endopeptidase inhibitor IseA family protein [Andreesenia angusta]|nr:DL-endopeptidase inhibitor IseA family protein [Andreesenia angusta]
MNKDELKDSIVKGKDIIFKILTSRDQDKVDYENNRTGLTEEFNSIDKIKSALNPYYTDRYIEDFLKNILQAEEENGEITIALGDIGMWAEYSELNIKDIKDMGDNIYEVDYTAPSGVGDINHKATIEKVDNYWKMDKESNY